MSISARAVDALISSNRILVVGPSGSGKTYLSRRLGELLDRPVVHLDTCFWRPGWISTPQDEWRRVVDGLIRPARWIMDGTYESTFQVRLAAADAVIVIERSRWSCLWGVLRRTMTHGNALRPDAPPGQPIDRAFLRYIWRYPGHTRPLVRHLLAEHGRHTTVVVLDSAKDIDRLVLQCEAIPTSSESTRPESTTA